MQIRAMKTEDVNHIEELMKQLGYPCSVAQLQMRFHKLLNAPGYQTFVAEIEGDIVGLIGMAKQIAYEFDDSYVRVLALVVHEDYRRRNIGQNLMVAAENWAIENDCKVVTLNSGNREEREAAHKFYENLGYLEKSTGFLKSLKYHLIF